MNPEKKQDFRWDDPGMMPMSNGPIRTVTGPLQLTYALDSDRHEVEYLVPFPFHAVDPSPWPPLQLVSEGIPLSIYRPIPSLETHATKVQIGNEHADAYCTVIRVSAPLGKSFTNDAGWRAIKRLLEWIRVKCRHYWLLHGLNGFGATYRGTSMTRHGLTMTHQNIAMYGPNVIVNPLTIDVWASIQNEMDSGADLPLADSLFCDSLLSIVAGDSMKALLEAAVAMEVALTQLLVDVSTAPPATPAKTNFIKKKGDRDNFGKKLMDWTERLDLTRVEAFSLPTMDASWHETVRDLYQMRNGVAHGGRAMATSGNVVRSMYAAGALLEYCRQERLRHGLGAFSMPTQQSPWAQIRFCHDACISVTSNVLISSL
jgi:hypothetical protein